MSILIRRVVTLALTLVTLTLLAACGPSNNVRLIYNTNTSAVPPPARFAQRRRSHVQ